MKSPGIVFDPEHYNLYRINQESDGYGGYQLEFIGARWGRSPQHVRSALWQLGVEMADIVNREHPESKILMLFTGLALVNNRESKYGKGRFETVEVLTLGMLDRAREKGYRFALFDGGETDIYYFNPGPESLKKRMEWRRSQLRKWLDLYPGLKMAGPISPWIDKKRITGWLAAGQRAHPCSFKDFRDFKPIFDLLFDAYPLVWVYPQSSDIGITFELGEGPKAFNRRYCELFPNRCITSEERP